MLKQMDWGAGDPLGAGLLPIVPFFGGALQTMPAMDGPPVDPSAVPPSGLFQVAGMDPSTAPPAGLFQMPSADPNATSAIDPSADAASAFPATMAGPAGPSATTPFQTPAIGPSAMLTAGPFATLTQSSSPQAGFDFADWSAASPQPWTSGAQPMPDPNAGMAGVDGQPLLQPAVVTNWGDPGAQDGALPAAGSTGAVAPSLMLAAQQAPPSNRPGLRPTGPTIPPRPVQMPVQASDPLHAEYAFQGTINQILGSGKLAPDKMQLLQSYATRAGRPLNPGALKWVIQNAGNGQKIGRFTPGEILSYAQRGAGLRDRLMLSGFNPRAAAALAANAMVESHAYYGTSQENGGNGYGLWQWDPVRRGKFEQLMGKKFSDATEDDQIRFLSWELQHERGYKASWAALNSDQDASSMARAFALNYERMKDKVDDPKQRAAIASVLSTIPFDPTKPARPPSGPPPEVQAYIRRRAGR